ncbi:MAG TPA: CAP domain-containing protein [Polyangiaceae bacterium]|nr:CAP domain-containing protein [Polyangiaceae bacterium]
MILLSVPHRIEHRIRAFVSVAAIAIGCARHESQFTTTMPTVGNPAIAFGSGLPKVQPGSGILKLEREMFGRLNRDRAERGLPPLAYDERLAEIGRFHSSDMRDKGFFAHESPTTGALVDRLNRAGYLFITARENLAEAPDVQKGEDTLLASPGHFANIMAPNISHVGIGIVKGGLADASNLLITQVFATPAHIESTAVARSGFIQQIQKQRAERGLPAAAPHAFLNNLANEHIAELGDENRPERVNAVAQKITAVAASSPHNAAQSILVVAQLLPDSSNFEVPGLLLAQKATQFGLAVRRAKSANGRPLLQLLLIVSR